MKKRELHKCGDCANCKPVTDRHNLLSIRGEPTLGVCKFWKNSKCVLLSWLGECNFFKEKTYG